MAEPYQPKIVFLTNYWKNSHGGGIRTYVTGLNEGLKTRGINAPVVFRKGEDPENYRINGSSYLFPLRSLFVLGKIKPDVIHAHGSWFCLLPGYLWKQFKGTRLVFTFHTVVTDPGFVERRLMKILVKKCDAITFGSEHLERQAKEIYGITNEESHIIQAGVAPRIVTEDEIRDFKNKFGLIDGNAMILGQGLTAHAVKVEGVKRLIIAIKDLQESCPNIVLVLTRESAYVPELRSFAKDQGMEQTVIFTGDLDNPFVAIKACDVLAHITLDDSIPLAVLEAMSLGTPIVASEVGGIPEIINERNGQLVSNDPKDIARAIDYFLKNKDIAKIRGQQAEQDVKRYCWDNTLNVFVSLYNPPDHTPKEVDREVH